MLGLVRLGAPCEAGVSVGFSKKGGASPAVTGAGGPSARGIRVSDVVLDTSPARRVLALWKSTPRAGSGDGRSRAEATRIAETRPYHTLRVFLRQFACNGTEAQVARAIESPDSGLCGFGMDPAYQSQDSIAAMVRELDARGDSLRRRIVARAGRYLPEGRGWRTTSVWFVIASQGMFDAVTLDGGSFERDWRGRKVAVDPALPRKGEPVILVNLTEVLTYGGTTKQRIDELENVLAHEMFHAGMRILEPQLTGWAEGGAGGGGGGQAGGGGGGGMGSRDPDLRYIARVMLDEGIAHYVDWRDRPEADTLFIWKPSINETRAFERLAITVDRFRRDPNPENRREALQLAGHGPLWSKYGAISGMFAAYRIEMARGLAALREAVAAGPSEFLRTYREVALRNPVLARVPVDLIQNQ